MKIRLTKYIRDFYSIIFRNGCYMCERPLMKYEGIFCNYCKIILPKTGFETMAENPVAKHLWGKADIKAATSFLHFYKGANIQEAIHKLKYNHKKQIGIVLGEWFGTDLAQAEPYASAHYLVPVPLHKARMLRRGYNQSEMIAIGMSRKMNIPVETQLLQRGVATSTQTKKQRYERYENMRDVFLQHHHPQFEGKKFIIVDDVLTTGSTLAACAEVLNQIPGSTVLVATIAFANR